MRLFALLLCALAFALAAPPTMASTFTPDTSWHAVPADTLLPFVLAMPAAIAVPKGTFAKLVARFKTLLPDKTDDEIQALVAAELTEQDTSTSTPPPLPSAPAPAQADANVQALTASVAQLQQQVSGLTEALQSEKAARADAQKAIETQQTKDRDAKVAAALDKAISEGRIEAAKRDEWKGRLEKDFDGFTAAIEAIPSKTTPAKGTDAASTTTQAKAPASSALRPDVNAYLATALAGNATAASA